MPSGDEPRPKAAGCQRVSCKRTGRPRVNNLTMAVRFASAAGECASTSHCTFQEAAATGACGGVAHAARRSSRVKSRRSWRQVHPVGGRGPV